jgi:hypothetical protein
MNNELWHANGRLKKAIKTHLALAGGPSLELAQLLLKVPDIIDQLASGDKNRAVEYTDELATCILRALLEHLQVRVSKCRDGATVELSARLTGYLISVGPVMANVGPADRPVEIGQVTQLRLYTMLQDGLDLLNAVNGIAYPKIN